MSSLSIGSFLFIFNICKLGNQILSILIEFDRGLKETSYREIIIKVKQGGFLSKIQIPPSPLIFIQKMTKNLQIK